MRVRLFLLAVVSCVLALAGYMQNEGVEDFEPTATAGLPARADRWEAKGNRLLIERNGELSLFSVGASTRPILRVDGADGRLSADGSLVAFSRGEELYVVGERRGEAWRIARHRVGRYDWSPDGRRLTFGMKMGGRTNVFCLDMNDSSRLMQITLDGGVDPSWLPSGKGLLYRGTDGALYLIRLDEPGAPRRLTDPTLSARLGLL